MSKRGSLRKQIRKNRKRSQTRAEQQHRAIEMAKELRVKMVQSFHAQREEGTTDEAGYAEAILSLALSTDTELIGRFFEAQRKASQAAPGAPAKADPANDATEPPDAAQGADLGEKPGSPALAAAGFRGDAPKEARE